MSPVATPEQNIAQVPSTTRPKRIRKKTVRYVDDDFINLILEDVPSDEVEAALFDDDLDIDDTFKETGESDSDDVDDTFKETVKSDSEYIPDSSDDVSDDEYSSEDYDKYSDEDEDESSVLDDY